ncbi:MAG: peptidoglycan DD-metalloendopeptidase family protein [Bacteroidia bacterium]|nr:peptidoglycan DD-metalloendopeptidase family protein [Bacteroidia bacterium]
MFCFFSIELVSQTNKAQLEQKKNQIQKEIQTLNDILKETKASKRNSLNHLITLNTKIEKRKELIETIQEEIEVLNRQSARVQSEIESVKQTLVLLKKEYATMIRSAQKQSNHIAKLSFIFSAHDVKQSFLRLKYIGQYSDFRKKHALKILRTQRELVKKYLDLQQIIREKNTLLGNEMEEKNKLEEEKTNKEILVAELQTKEEEIKQKLEEHKREMAALKEAIRKIIEEEMRKREEERKRKLAEMAAAEKKKKEEAQNKGNRKNNKKDHQATIEKTEAKEVGQEKLITETDREMEALSQNFEDNRGKLPWPVQRGVICEPYGEHEHPAIKGFMVMNNGVEICSIMNADARCIFDGEVTRVAPSPAGGKMVIVRHGEYLSVYTHLREAYVKQGDKVKARQPIGKIIENEEEGKSTMNFQIWKGQKTLNPSEWLGRVN